MILLAMVAAVQAGGIIAINKQCVVLKDTNICPDVTYPIRSIDARRASESFSKINLLKTQGSSDKCKAAYAKIGCAMSFPKCELDGRAIKVPCTGSLREVLSECSGADQSFTAVFTKNYMTRTASAGCFDVAVNLNKRDEEESSEVELEANAAAEVEDEAEAEDIEVEVNVDAEEVEAEANAEAEVERRSEKPEEADVEIAEAEAEANEEAEAEAEAEEEEEEEEAAAEELERRDDAEAESNTEEEYFEEEDNQLLERRAPAKCGKASMGTAIKLINQYKVKNPDVYAICKAITGGSECVLARCLNEKLNLGWTSLYKRSEGAEEEIERRDDIEAETDAEEESLEEEDDEELEAEVELRRRDASEAELELGEEEEYEDEEEQEEDE
ncbi:hypothetical protein HDU97_007503 [Phlyctochytrium planicorne]|nr:hypothetical protein HDU97_007503 [Phlyctochytrium planicorne]